MNLEVQKDSDESDSDSIVKPKEVSNIHKCRSREYEIVFLLFRTRVGGRRRRREKTDLTKQ